MVYGKWHPSRFGARVAAGGADCTSGVGAAGTVARIDLRVLRPPTRGRGAGPRRWDFASCCGVGCLSPWTSTGVSKGVVMRLRGTASTGEQVNSCARGLRDAEGVVPFLLS